MILINFMNSEGKTSERWRNFKLQNIACRYGASGRSFGKIFDRYADKQAVGGRPPQYAPPLSSLCGRRSASHRRADRASRLQTAM